MSTLGPQFLSFPEPMVEELRRLEQAKMHLIAGFLYATGLKGKTISVAADLSGIEVSKMTQPEDRRNSQTPPQDNTHI
jgi:hypothetical protein